MNAVLLLIALLLPANPAIAGDGRFVGEGAAPGVTDAALEEAAAAAKQTIVADYVTQKTGMDDLSPFAPILDRAEAYIHSAEIVGRYEAEGSTRVELAAALFEDDLERDMQRLIELRVREPAPVLVLLEEPPAAGEAAAPAEQAPESNTAALLSQAIREAGYKPIALNEAAATPEEAAALAESEGEALANLGAAHFAEAVVAGKIDIGAKQHENTANVFTINARMALRVVQVRAGKVCERFEVHRRIHGADPLAAAELVRRDCVETVEDGLGRALLFATAQQRPPDEVQIELDTAGAPDAAALLRSLLDQVPLVEEVDVVLDAPPVSRLRVRYSGPLAPLTDALVAMAVDAGVFFDVRRAAGKDVTMAAALLQNTN